MNPGQQALDGLNLCSCGLGTEMEIVKEILQHAANQQSFHQLLNQPYGRWVDFALKVLDGAELIEHGTGISCVSLTDKGTAALEFLVANGTDQGEWV